MVTYDSKKIIPVQSVDLNKGYVLRGDSKKIGSTWNISVNGELVSFKGSPSSSGTWHTTSGYPADESISQDARLGSIIRKQEALQLLFANEGQSFEVQSADGSAPLKCNPRVKSVRFPAGPWSTRCPFTVELEADIIYINGTAYGADNGDVVDYKLSNFDESWNLEIADETQKLFRLTHSISANGKRFYESDGSLPKEAWENARDYVLTKKGLDANMLTVLAPTGYNLQTFNYNKTQSANKAGGAFNLQENWTCYDPGAATYKATEEYTITIRNDVLNGGLVTTSIEGRVQGFEVNDSDGLITQTKFYNASGYYFGTVNGIIFDRVQNSVSDTLHPLNTQYSLSMNPRQGVISYNYEFNNRPTMSLGGLSETITIGYDNPGRVVAEIPVVGRLAGPVLQDIGSTTGRRKTLSIEAVFAVSSQDYTASQPDTDSIVTSYEPAGTYVFKIADQENFSPRTGRYSRQVTWRYEV